MKIVIDVLATHEFEYINADLITLFNMAYAMSSDHFVHFNWIRMPFKCQKNEMHFIWISLVNCLSTILITCVFLWTSNRNLREPYRLQHLHSVILAMIQIQRMSSQRTIMVMNRELELARRCMKTWDSVLHSMEEKLEPTTATPLSLIPLYISMATCHRQVCPKPYELTKYHWWSA